MFLISSGEFRLAAYYLIHNLGAEYDKRNEALDFVEGLLESDLKKKRNAVERKMKPVQKAARDLLLIEAYKMYASQLTGFILNPRWFLQLDEGTSIEAQFLETLKADKAEVAWKSWWSQFVKLRNTEVSEDDVKAIMGKFEAKPTLGASAASSAEQQREQPSQLVAVRAAGSDSEEGESDLGPHSILDLDAQTAGVFEKLCLVLEVKPKYREAPRETLSVSLIDHFARLQIGATREGRRRLEWAVLMGSTVAEKLARKVELVLTEMLRLMQRFRGWQTERIFEGVSLDDRAKDLVRNALEILRTLIMVGAPATEYVHGLLRGKERKLNEVIAIADFESETAEEIRKSNRKQLEPYDRLFSECNLWLASRVRFLTDLIAADGKSVSGSGKHKQAAEPGARVSVEILVADRADRDKLLQDVFEITEGPGDSANSLRPRWKETVTQMQQMWRDSVTHDLDDTEIARIVRRKVLDAPAWKDKLSRLVQKHRGDDRGMRIFMLELQNLEQGQMSTEVPALTTFCEQILEPSFSRLQLFMRFLNIALLRKSLVARSDLRPEKTLDFQGDFVFEFAGMLKDFYHENIVVRNLPLLVSSDQVPGHAPLRSTLPAVADFELLLSRSTAFAGLLPDVVPHKGATTVLTDWVSMLINLRGGFVLVRDVSEKFAYQRLRLWDRQEKELRQMRDNGEPPLFRFYSAYEHHSDASLLLRSALLGDQLLSKFWREKFTPENMNKNVIVRRAYLGYSLDVVAPANKLAAALIGKPKQAGDDTLSTQKSGDGLQVAHLLAFGWRARSALQWWEGPSMRGRLLWIILTENMDHFNPKFIGGHVLTSYNTIELLEDVGKLLFDHLYLKKSESGSGDRQGGQNQNPEQELLTRRDTGRDRLAQEPAARPGVIDEDEGQRRPWYRCCSSRRASIARLAMNRGAPVPGVVQVSSSIASTPAAEQQKHHLSTLPGRAMPLREDDEACRRQCEGEAEDAYWKLLQRPPDSLQYARAQSDSLFSLERAIEGEHNRMHNRGGTSMRDMETKDAALRLIQQIRRENDAANHKLKLEGSPFAVKAFAFSTDSTARMRDFRCAFLSWVLPYLMAFTDAESSPTISATLHMRKRFAQSRTTLCSDGMQPWLTIYEGETSNQKAMVSSKRGGDEARNMGNALEAPVGHQDTITTIDLAQAAGNNNSYELPARVVAYLSYMMHKPADKLAGLTDQKEVLSQILTDLGEYAQDALNVLERSTQTGALVLQAAGRGAAVESLFERRKSVPLPEGPSYDENFIWSVCDRAAKLQRGVYDILMIHGVVREKEAQADFERDVQEAKANFEKRGNLQKATPRTRVPRAVDYQLLLRRITTSASGKPDRDLLVSSDDQKGMKKFWGPEQRGRNFPLQFINFDKSKSQEQKGKKKE
ncbi:unnamed protein product [Amoebophrya sp. A120]|nr:unnamed protein product [Amoebophrya sp. A120]|eukprot:GSA120T00004975001.1